MANHSVSIIAGKTQRFPPLVYNTRVSYEEAFAALKDGDFRTAVPLFEQAARETHGTEMDVNVFDMERLTVDISRNRHVTRVCPESRHLVASKSN